MSRSMHYCWDYFNEENVLKQMMRNNKWMTKGVIYCVVGLEIGDEKGNWHLQGYTEWKSCKSKEQLYEYVTGNKQTKFWADKRRGKPEEARGYCTKDKEFVEVGKLPVGQGKRTDLDNVRTALEDGAPLREIIKDNRLQSYQFAKIWMTWFEEERDWEPEVYWLWGVSGAGKTHRAKELAIKGSTYWLKIPEHGQKCWWDGYDKHECIIIDDYRQWCMSMRELITVIGSGPMRAEIKGGFRQLLAKRIIITTNKHPEKMYIHADEEIWQLTRRITNIEHFDRRWVDEKTQG